MRFFISITILALFANLAVAQKLSPMPAPEFKEKIQKEMIRLDQKEAKLKLEERRLDLARREREIDFHRKAMDKGFKDRMEDLKRGPLPLWKKIRKSRLFPLLIVAKLFFVLAFSCALACALLNVLLTILVFKDMRKRGDVNGLWVPIVLIGGLFATIAYAIFRKTDTAKSA